MITPGLCFSYKREVLEAIHGRQDEYYLALYTRDANLSPRTTVYTSGGETSGPGYEAGGKRLTGFSISGSGSTACLDFTAPEWGNASFWARGALVYNRSKGNRAVAVVMFDGDTQATLGTFSIDLPPAGDSTSLIRIT